MRERYRTPETGRGRPLALILATVCLLAGCATTNPKYDPALQSPTVAESFVAVEAGTDLSEIGALAILFPGNAYFQATHRLDGAPVATQTDGYLFLPLHPGEHILDTHVRGRSPHTKVLTVRPGTVLYLKPGNRFDSPFMETTRADFVALLDRLRLTEVRVLSESPVERFLPGSLRQLAEGCDEATAATLCVRALEEIPAPLLAPVRRQKIADLVATAAPEPVQAQAAAPPEPRRPAAPAVVEPLRAPTLPPEVERDRLMLAVGDLFAADRAGEALPYLERLDALPVPLDPAFDFYRAQAHLAAGNRHAAGVLLARFLGRVDRESIHYQPALRLMIRLEGEL